jgi:hypothetical protein
MGTFSLMPLSKVWHSLDTFSQKLKLLNGIMWRFSVPNFPHIIQEIWEVWVAIHLCPSVKHVIELHK